MTRRETLEKAMECVLGYREQDYGKPEDNFRVIASFWEIYLTKRCVSGEGASVDLYPEDVAIMMALMKIARTMGSDKADNYIDLAGYAACAAECALEEEK